MIATRIKQRLESNVIRLPDADALIGKNVEIIVFEDEEEGVNPRPRRPRVPGMAKGLIQTSDDIAAPLPDEIIEDFYK